MRKFDEKEKERWQREEGEESWRNEGDLFCDIRKNSLSLGKKISVVFVAPNIIGNPMNEWNDWILGFLGLPVDPLPLPQQSLKPIQFNRINEKKSTCDFPSITLPRLHRLIS